MVATLVDEWRRCGIRDAVISPGKRSTLMAAALERNAGIRTHVFVDERSAAFFALGMANATQRPTLLWCTSGTAVAEYHASVMEAHYGRVPLLVATADRPPETHHVRDWQAMQQRNIFGEATRWFFDLGIADEAMSMSWRSIAARSYIETLHNGAGPGPVHMNVPIREPFVVSAASPIAGRDVDQPWHQIVEGSDDVIAAAQQCRGVFVVGRSEVDPVLLHATARHMGWPVFAQHRSRCRGGTNAIDYFDEIIAIDDDEVIVAPELIVRIGDPLVTRRLERFSESVRDVWTIEPTLTWQTGVGRSRLIFRNNPDDVLRRMMQLNNPRVRNWFETWQRADDIAGDAVQSTIDAEPSLSEPFVARELMKLLPTSATLSCSTSMPVRDVEWYGRARDDVKVFANRGVSGLDGMLSSALGIAAGSDSLNVALVGDLGFLYDLSALWLKRGIMGDAQLTVVVVDNGGGGIFSAFPFADTLEPGVFNRVVASPTGVDIPSAVKGLGVECSVVETKEQFAPTVGHAIDNGGVHVVYVKVDNDVSVALRRRITAEISAALQELVE